MKEQLRPFDASTVHYLQWLQNTLTAWFGVTILVVDRQEQPRTTVTRQSRLAHLLQQKQERPEQTAENIHYLCWQNRRTGAPALARCPDTGLLLAGVPILTEGEYSGSWIIGLLRLQEQKLSDLQQAARLRGLDSSEMAEPLLEAPMFAETQLRELCAFLAGQGEILDRNPYPLRQPEVAAYFAEIRTGEIVAANEVYARQLQQPLRTLIGQVCWQACGEGQGLCACCPRHLLLSAAGEVLPRPQRISHYQAGLGRWRRAAHQALKLPDGRVLQYVACREFPQPRQEQEELLRLAYYDRLLQIPNDLKLVQDMAATLACAGEHFLLCFDVRSMHQLNAVYGWEAGDALLRTIVAWCQIQNWPQAQLYRVSGDSFALWLRQSDLSQAQAIVQAIERRFSQAWQIPMGESTLTYYCGVSLALLWPGVLGDLDNLGSLVARTLELAQQQGRVIFYDEEMERQHQEQMQLALSLKHCVKQDMQGFDVHYQPIVELSSGCWKGLEALCRWDCPVYGTIPPAVFIPQAEQAGLIQSIGEWVLETAVRHCKELELDQQEGFFLSVNVSPLQLMSTGFVAAVQDVLQRYQYPGGQLNLEVTESAEFILNNFTFSVLEHLQSLGVTIALDDFGTGYSSFHILRQLPVHYLKTERCFMQEIEADDQLQYFYYMMSEFSHAYDQKLIAEGVETEKQLNLTYRNGADYVQGYYFSKPLPFVILEQSLEHFRQPGCLPRTEPARHPDLRQWLGSRAAHELAPSLFRLLQECLQAVLKPQELSASMEQLLALSGRHFDLTRTFVLLHDPRTQENQFFQWCQPQAEPYRIKVTPSLFQKISQALLPHQRQDGLIVHHGVEWLRELLGPDVVLPQTSSLLTMPLHCERSLRGFIGFGAKEPRDWRAQEYLILRNIGDLLENSLRQDTLKQRLELKDQLLYEAFNSLETSIYITDPVTNELLWVNRHFKQHYGSDKQVLGHKCYEVLEGRCGSCEHCRLDRLLTDPHQKRADFECYSLKHRQYCRLYQMIAQWDVDRRVNLVFRQDLGQEARANSIS